MSAVFNPYATLGISKSCRDIVRIRRAFNEKAKLVHPDRPGADEKAFRRLKKAYDYIIRKADLVREEERLDSQTNEERLENYKRDGEALPPIPKSGVDSKPWRNEIEYNNSIIYVPDSKPTEQVSGEIGLWKKPEGYCPETCSAEVVSTGGILFIKETSPIIDFVDAIEMERIKLKKTSTGSITMDAKRFLQQETVGYLETEPVLERKKLAPNSSERQSYEQMRDDQIEANDLEKEKSRNIVMGHMDKFSVNFKNMVTGTLGINF